MTTPLDTRELVANVQTNREVGVPYTDDMIAECDGRPQGAGEPRCARSGGAAQALSEGAVVRKFNPATPDITEGDAVVAYLQMLGTLVDFNLYDNKANLR